MDENRTSEYVRVYVGTLYEKLEMKEGLAEERLQ